jgi:A/G-specific adenine glycosylase
MSERFHETEPNVNAKAFVAKLLAWFHKTKRRLPWRGARDPYKIWVSEVMLQQTRVETVIPYYKKWLKTFPTVKKLASARENRVLKLWEGLGYYARARNLHRAARQISGKLPRTAAEWGQLSGVGPYTAAAIASIAFDERIPVLDGNVLRVLSRIFAVRDNVRAPKTQKKLQIFAQNLMPMRHAGDFNQAMMELGALVCVPKNPRCDACPVRKFCAARALGIQNSLPNRGKVSKPKRKIVHAALVIRDGKLLATQRPPNGQLARLWELPNARTKSALERVARVKISRKICAIRHSITDSRIELRVYDAKFCGENGEFLSKGRAKTLPFSAAHRKIVEKFFSG